MTALQTINLGTPPAGSDGDAVRTGFAKVNSNVGVLNAQAALTSSTVITAAQALTNAYVGKRVNINLTSAGTINMPAASTCAADQVTLLRNIGMTVVTLTITTGSGDTVALSKLNPGESALMDTDGVHAWNVLMRGRTNSDNEVVNGNCAVNGNTNVAGTLGVAGSTSLTSLNVTGASNLASLSVTGAAAVGSLSSSASGGVAAGTGGVTQNGAGNQKAVLSNGFVFSSATGGINPASDKYVEMYHDGTTAGLAMATGANDWAGIITATAAQKSAGIPLVFGRNSPVVWAYFNGLSTLPASITTFGCTVARLGVGSVRVYLSSVFTFATHMLIIGGIPVSNGTNWVVPQITNFASDGSYVDIGGLATGSGTGSAAELLLSLLILKVR
ncbi:hypothetical protein KDX01_07430 [Burkholderia vietnamiensis]|uniref:hypothetical protein n=1 Tax=Burkholderia vietnamiensis TaxID=60552 RepID=UPI001B9A8F71|nr:hypothetical protein [Burkholderia vietnamiensis]MBR7972947.1 hypothetical protein [Burkholderia vietnamiensis]